MFSSGKPSFLIESSTQTESSLCFVLNAVLPAGFCKTKLNPPVTFDPRQEVPRVARFGKKHQILLILVKAVAPGSGNKDFFSYRNLQFEFSF